MQGAHQDIGAKQEFVGDRQKADIFPVRDVTPAEIASKRFKVRHMAFGMYPRDYVFTRQQFEKDYPLPPKAVGKFDAKGYHDAMLSRALRSLGGVQGPAIVPTDEPAGGKLIDFGGQSGDFFAGEADLSPTELKEAVKPSVVS